MLVTMDVGWTTFPVVPKMTRPVADVTGTDPAGNTLARTAFIGLILSEIVQTNFSIVRDHSLPITKSKHLAS